MQQLFSDGVEYEKLNPSIKNGFGDVELDRVSTANLDEVYALLVSENYLSEKNYEVLGIIERYFEINDKKTELEALLKSKRSIEYAIDKIYPFFQKDQISQYTFTEYFTTLISDLYNLTDGETQIKFTLPPLNRSLRRFKNDPQAIISSTIFEPFHQFFALYGKRIFKNSKDYGLFAITNNDSMEDRLAKLKSNRSDLYLLLHTMYQFYGGKEEIKTIHPSYIGPDEIPEEVFLNILAQGEN